MHCPGAGACTVAIDSHTTAGEVRPEKGPMTSNPPCQLLTLVSPASWTLGLPRVSDYFGKGGSGGDRTKRPLPIESTPPRILARPLSGLTFPSLSSSRWLESWWGGWAWPAAATHSHCTSSEGPRSEPWLGGPSWPTCSPGLRSKCPAPALLSISPYTSQLRSVAKRTLSSACPWPCAVVFAGLQTCLPQVCSPTPASPPRWAPPRPRPKHMDPPPPQAALAVRSGFSLVRRPLLFCSLAAEEAGLEDSPDSGWRLCLRLHGPLHPEGLSPDGHELPFLFEQVRLSGVHASKQTPKPEPLVFGLSRYYGSPAGGLTGT